MALNMKKFAAPLMAACLLMAPSFSVQASIEADPFNNGKPSALAMLTDLVLIRPIGVVATGLGALVYVVALPFTAASGGITEAGDVLVVEPAVYTFVRCLGCTRPGYNKTVTAERSAAASDESEPATASTKNKHCKNYACKPD